MPLSNYTELKAAIADWLNRADLTTQIPDFIALAEARFNRELRLNAMLKRDTTTATTDYIDLPEDWLDHNSITVTSGAGVQDALTYITNDEYNRLRHANLSGTFRYYTIRNNSILLLPSAASGVTVPLEIFYYGKIPALSASNATNWLLTRSPDLYLYGALIAAEAYLQNDDRLPVWVAQAQSIIDSMNIESERAKRPEGRLVQRKRTFG